MRELLGQRERRLHGAERLLGVAQKPEGPGRQLFVAMKAPFRKRAFAKIMDGGRPSRRTRGAMRPPGEMEARDFQLHPPGFNLRQIEMSLIRDSRCVCPTRNIRNTNGVLLAPDLGRARPTLDRWTFGQVVELFRQEFGIRYHPSHVRKALTAQGCDARGPRAVR